MIEMSPTGIKIVAQGNKTPELTGTTQLCTYLVTASGTASFTGGSGWSGNGSHRLLVNLSTANTVTVDTKTYNIYDSNFTHFYVIYITPTSLPAASPIAGLLNKKFQLAMALPYNITGSATGSTPRLQAYDILTARVVKGSPSYIEFQATDALNLDSLTPRAQSSIQFSWQVHTYYYKNYTYT